MLAGYEGFGFAVMGVLAVIALVAFVVGCFKGTEYKVIEGVRCSRCSRIGQVTYLVFCGAVVLCGLIAIVILT